MKNNKLTKLRVRSIKCLISVIFIWSISLAVNATVVEVRTNVGNFSINVFDKDTPLTAENFLSYVNAGAYANNTVHRSAPNFVIQMGGFQFNNVFPPEAIATGTPVTNEPVLSNVRGTIAMAKLSGNPNSATSQFFVNLSNNASNLDTSNGGFTVFGQVLDDGMDVVDQIAALSRYNFSGAFAEIPLRNYTATNANNNTLPTEDNVIIITDIVVIDANEVTNPSLNPIRNTLINGGGSSSNGSGGGSLSIGVILAVMLIAMRKRKANLN